MRVAKFGMLGFGALLAARVIVGCSSDEGEAGYDAGTLPDVVLGDDAASNGDTNAPSGDDDAGGDATVSGDDDGGGSSGDDGGADTAPEGTDASDGGHEVNASDAGHEVDASDGGHELDASDGGHDHDASDGATSDVDASDAAPSESDASDAASSEIDASDASSSADASDASDASDAAPACTSCGTTISFLGNEAAFVTGTATSVTLQGGTVPDGAQASVIAQTYPQNSVGAVHLLYSIDSFATQVDLVMTFDTQTNNNDQWYAILPVQSAGTTVSWYLRADGCDCTTSLYGQPGPLVNYTYTEE